MNKRGFTVINIPFKTVTILIVLAIGMALILFLIARKILSIELLPK